MPRPSGFTDAELAAAAWRRNMKNKGANAQDVEVRINFAVSTGFSKAGCLLHVVQVGKSRET